VKILIACFGRMSLISGIDLTVCYKIELLIPMKKIRGVTLLLEFIRLTAAVLCICNRRMTFCAKGIEEIGLAKEWAPQRFPPCATLRPHGASYPAATSATATSATVCARELIRSWTRRSEGQRCLESRPAYPSRQGGGATPSLTIKTRNADVGEVGGRFC
jgi:hypothetical protein